MSNSGRNTYKGINSQAWAAMSLFLQYIQRPEFNQIIFEGKKLEDFCLVFSDGRKIICESKASHINYNDVRDILSKIIGRGQVNLGDEILIICESINPDVKRDIEYLEYFNKEIRAKLKNKQHKFTNKEINLLRQVKFWEIKQKYSIKTVTFLISDVLKIWVPAHILGEIVCNLMVTEVYFGSQEGETLTKDEFLQKIENRKEQIIKDVGYEKEKENSEKRLKKIILALRKPQDKSWASDEISVLSTRPNELYFTLNKLKEEKISLDDWDKLLEAASMGVFVVELFQIFKNNITSKENQKYFLKFASSLLDDNFNFYRDEFIKVDIIRICQEMIGQGYDKKIFESVKKLYKPTIRRYFYLEQRQDEKWPIEQVSKFLKELFDKTRNIRLKKEIISYARKKFNLIKDEGTFWHYTPPEIFEIIKNNYENRPKKLIEELIPILSKQFNDFYKKFGKQLSFKGWEHMGSAIGQFGSTFSINDRHFIIRIITPILLKFYKINPHSAWKFVTSECITLEKKVSETKPDFLNRAVIPIIVGEYAGDKNKKQSFKILCDFIKMRRGIPNKAELIFQTIKNRKDISDQDKWALVEFSLKEFNNLPVNVFVEQIVFDLVSKSHPAASQVIDDWVKNPEYNINHFVGSYGPTDGLLMLMENNLESGISFLEQYISTDNFKKKLSPFDVYDIAKSLTKLIENEEYSDRGIGILKETYKGRNITINQQVLIFNSIDNISEDKKEVIKKIFDKFLYPTLKRFKNNQGLERRISHRNARESMVQFAEKLAKVGYYKDSLGLLKIFIKDSDPPKDGNNYFDDKNGDFNYHQKLFNGEDPMVISTVRGWCAHVLSRFALLKARKYIPEAVGLLRKLSEDSNYYVRYETCIPLIEFVKNRRAIMPNSDNESFMELKTAVQIERIAFNMLVNKDNQKIKALMKRLVDVFGYMRGISQKKAELFLKTILKTGFDEVATEASPLFIYFAEFREKDFKDKIFSYVFAKNEYKKILEFDSKPFKEILEKLIQEGPNKVKAKLSWHFWKLPTENKKLIGVSFKYFNKLVKKYSRDVYNDIYYFVSDNIDENPGRCINLWKECIKNERPEIERMVKIDKISEVYWWPYHHNGEILLKILEHESKKEFLNWLEILADYPKEVNIAGDLNLVVQHLKNTKSHKKQVERIFDKLIERNPTAYYDIKQEWLKNLKK